MPNEPLIAYIRSESARGIDRAVIMQSLLAAGWRLEDANAAMSTIDARSTPNSAPPPPRASAAQTVGTLKDQYPLSPRKYWKKMIEKTFLWVVILLLASPIVIIPVMDGGSSGSILASLGIVLLILALFMGTYSLYVRAYIRRYYYDATDSYITIKKGVFAPAEIHVQYSKIQDVYVDQDIIDRIMGLYDVHLASATAASGIEAHIDGVEHAAADGLKHFLLQKLQTKSGASVAQPSAIPGTPLGVPSQPVTFASEISSTTYPITGAWYVQQMFVWFFSSLFVSGLVAFYLVAPGKQGASSIAELFNLGSGTPWIVFVVTFVIVYAFHMIYMVLWRSTYAFNFLPDYIVTKQGIIAKSENHLPYRSIQDVTVSQGIIERMLGIATVRIENAAAVHMVGKSVATSAVLIPGQPLVRANEISDVIKHTALTKNSSQTGL